MTDGTLAAAVGLRYPADWSRKAARGGLRPHLSTIDAILLAVQLGELYLTHAHGLDDEARRRLWVRRLRIRAGTSPDEELAEVTTRTRPAPVGAAGDESVAVLDSRIGGMRVRCEIVGVPAVPPRAGRAADYGDPAALLGPAADRYYGSGFARRGQRLDDLAVHTDDRVATATVTPTGGDAGRAGIEGAYQPAPTVVDCFATALQLAQILLYETDSMRRGDSNTLWMRNTELTVAAPPGALPDRLPLHTSLTGLDLLTMNGALWRAAQINGQLGAITLRCAVAHALPAGAATADPSGAVSVLPVTAQNR